MSRAPQMGGRRGGGRRGSHDWARRCAAAGLPLLAPVAMCLSDSVVQADGPVSAMPPGRRRGAGGGARDGVRRRSDRRFPLATRKVRAKDSAAHVGIAECNVSLRKSGRVRGIRETLDRIGTYPDCRPGDILVHQPDDGERAGG